MQNITPGHAFFMFWIKISIFEKFSIFFLPEPDTCTYKTVTYKTVTYSQTVTYRSPSC